MKTDNALQGAAEVVRGAPATGDYMLAAGKATPPLAVAGASLAGMGLQEWVFALTIVYLALQIAHLIWKFFREGRRGEA